MKLSIVMPAIRKEQWQDAYDSMCAACSDDFELIVVGPTSPEIQETTGRVFFVYDGGSQARALQHGLDVATGDWVAWAADDGRFEAHAFDDAFKQVEPEKRPTMISGRFIEGDHPHPNVLEDSHYRAGAHWPMKELAGINPDWMMLNGGMVIRRMNLELVGGLDCRFETMGMALPDLAFRLQQAGTTAILTDKLFCKFSHLPGESGDHGPVHRAFFDHDLNLFMDLWRTPGVRDVLPMDNWKQAPEIWERRFGK